MMTIEIHKPEIEALIQQRLQSGAFNDVEEVLLDALQSSAPPPPANLNNMSLVEIFAIARGLTEDIDFSRDPSFDRPIVLS